MFLYGIPVSLIDYFPMGQTISIKTKMEICRSCLIKSPEICYFDMLQCNLIAIYEDLTAIQVLATDTVTNLLCKLCKQTLESFKSFKNQCLESWRLLNNKETELIHIPNLSASAQSQSKKIKKQHSPSTGNSREFIVEDGIKKFPCRFCKRKKFVRIKAVEKHEEGHSQTKAIICDLCGAVLINQQSLKSHKRYKHSDERPFPCEQCTLCFKSKAELTEHVAVCHIQERKFICDICSQSSKSLKTLRRHIKRVHFTEKTHPCSMCDRSFKDRAKLQQHFICHTGARPFVCDICSRAFGHPTTLRKHKIIHTDGKNRSPAVTCKDCLKVLQNPKTLVQHRFDMHKTIYTSWKKANKGFKYYKKDNDGSFNKQIITSSTAEDEKLVQQDQN